jgi:transposase InsO family protein
MNKKKIFRRAYRCPPTNKNWHCDGNHKLSKFRLVIHGFIDGFTRLITGLHVSNNNKSSTVFDYYLQAIDKHGFPSTMRSDKGGENIVVAECQLYVRGHEGFHTGTSTHNQRVERLWLDVRINVIVQCYNIMEKLYKEYRCDYTRQDDVYVVHYLFIPMIQADLDVFVGVWNNHKLSTFGNFTPRQLWTLYEDLIPPQPALSNEEMEHISNLTPAAFYDQLVLEALEWNWDEAQRLEFVAEVSPFAAGDYKLDHDYLANCYSDALQIFRRLNNIQL